MSKIKIKNFGPIKDGYLEDDGFLDIKKVTVFIGNQGSGKSTVAKLISCLSWMEKAINRGDLDKGKISFDEFYKICGFQGIKNYFLADTIIEYVGDAYSILYDFKKKFPIINEIDSNRYTVPKIMYVPAERNFLTTIQSAFNVTGLPGPLLTFGEELKRAQTQLNGDILELPINNYRYAYDKATDTSTVIGNDHKINLLEASSGFQSAIPLFIVSRNIALPYSKNSGYFLPSLSVTQSIRRNEEITMVAMDANLPENLKKIKQNQIDAKYTSRCFHNIVEEPEQNLFPTSQREILNSLLEFNNMNEGNKLIMTTHSPYLINYLTLAVKANNVYGMLREKKYKLSDPEFGYTNEIVPMSSTIDADDLVIYELDETEGTIKKLGNFEGIPSDKNFLNKSLGKANLLFDSLLEIEEEL